MHINLNKYEFEWLGTIDTGVAKKEIALIH